MSGAPAGAPNRHLGLRGEKAVLRREIRRRLASIDAGHRAERGGRIREHLLRSDPWKSSETLFAFLSLPSEPDIDPIIREALDRGMSVAVPRIDAAGITFRRIDSPEGPWTVHPYGVREPAEETEIVDLSASGLVSSHHDSTLFLVPGLAFDLQGNRLGRGKAYYDRFLTSLLQPVSRDPEDPGRRRREPALSTVETNGPAASRGIHIVGCCFSEQLIERVPAGPTDVPVDGLVTDGGYVVCTRSPCRR
jgi:5-formyltetrahydrofolate cyclo-ligase